LVFQDIGARHRFRNVAHCARPLSTFSVAVGGSSLTGRLAGVKVIDIIFEAPTNTAVSARPRQQSRQLFSRGLDPATITKESAEREVGKRCELAFGYAGGLGAWRAFEKHGTDTRYSDDQVEGFKQECEKSSCRNR
jgi:hypothetical protein